MNGLSGDACEVLQIIIAIAAERRGEHAIAAPKPMAGAVADRTAGKWATHGSDMRLNKALQELRKAGKAKYVKGTGWVPAREHVDEPVHLDEEDPGLGGLAKTLEKVAEARAASTVEITFELSRSTAKLLVKAFALDHDNHVIRRAAEGPVKETDPDLMEEAQAARDFIRMICGVAEDD